MDTKWKKRKMAVSFGVFFLSVSLLLGNGLYVIRETLQQDSFQEMVNKTLKPDYQNTASFRRYLQSRLSNFLAMATGGSIGGYDYVALEAFHEDIRRDKNLLYRITEGGRELYANLDGIAWDAGSGTLPKGYNFRLDFNGENVSIRKDGEELDIYGDGYYRGGDQWYVPGYQNFAADESLRSVNITIFAAADPVSYSYAAYGEEGFSQTGNRLYDLAQEVRMEHNGMRRATAGLAAGAALFVAYLCMRREKRAADLWIAGYTGRIWFEVKLGLLLLAAGLCGLPGYAAGSASGIFIRQVQDEAVTEATEGLDGLAQVQAVGEDAGFAAESSGSLQPFSLEWLEEPVPWTEVLLRMCDRPGFLLLLFWVVYFLGNDYFKNRGHFLDGCFRKLIQSIRADTWKQPFAVQQVRRVLVPAAAGVLAAAVQLLATGIGFTGFFSRTEILCVQLLVIVLLLAVISGCLMHARRQAGELDFLADQICAVRDGDYTEKDSLPADSCFKPLSDSLSQIRRGMDTAVKEQLKSERMKVELVANVSHDLKTPLTSIISYLAFLKQEEGLPEHVQDYIRILDQKAGRLNSMVQDVFAISKAASGQLLVELEELDFGKLLRQTLADMQEQIQAGTVTLKTEIPQEAVMIQADGARMYRVFQNLILNALQYSLEGSRIFVALTREDGYASADIKNISKQELRAGADFTERFVRGDESRTDDGSGLGLSIAKSFTEACGGTFALETDADLFAVRIRFAIVR